jgi:hypothetical protein
MSQSGIPAMVECSFVLEKEQNLETLSNGKEGLAPKDSHTLVMIGRWILYDVTLDGGWVMLSVQLMDLGDPLQQITAFADGPLGWKRMHDLITRFEESECRSLQRPIDLGDWVIA